MEGSLEEKLAHMRQVFEQNVRKCSGCGQEGVGLGDNPLCPVCVKRKKDAQFKARFQATRPNIEDRIAP